MTLNWRRAGRGILQTVAVLCTAAALSQQAAAATPAPAAAPPPAAVVAAAPAVAPQAQVIDARHTALTVKAAASNQCYWPQVCLSYRGQITGRYRQVTSYWQYLGKSFGANVIDNRRRDDRVRVKTTFGAIVCVPPRTRQVLWNGGATAVNIDRAPIC
jgi:hypothetical protein